MRRYEVIHRRALEARRAVAGLLTPLAGYFAVGIAGIAASVFAAPSAANVAAPATAALGVIALVIGLVRHRPAPCLPWSLIATGAVVKLAGDVVWAVIYHRDGTVPFPSFVDAIYLSAFLFFMAGLLLLPRPQTGRSSWDGLLDSAIACCGVLVVTWSFVIEPYLNSGELAGWGLTIALAYPVTDLLLFVALCRLAFTAAAHTPAFLFLLSACGAMLAGDVIFAISLSHGFATGGTAVSIILWLTAYLLLGAGGLHPSVARSATLTEQRVVTVTWVRVAMFGLFGLLGPVAWVGTAITHGSTELWSTVLIPAAAVAVLSMLLVIRLVLLARLAHRRAETLDRQAIALNTALSEQEALQAQLSHRAMHDPLTGLGNRALLRERLEESLPGAGTLLLMDLDGFKDVNDTFGHPVGDSLLVEVARRLRATVDPADTLVRLGGDEFAILLVGADAEAAETVAGRALVALRAPYLENGRELHLTTSIGMLTVADGEQVTPAVALRNVDLALYAAKEAGKNQVVAFRPELRTARLHHASLVAGLRQAVANGDFTLRYQPVVDLTSQRIMAVEALIRWHPPGGAPLSPAEFVPVAEETGLVVPMGAWVLREACAQAAEWYTAHGIAIAVNVSGRQLVDHDFADTVLDALRESGLPGEGLILEITETVLVAAATAEADAVTVHLHRLRRHGIRIAIDDFGTGYSSLAYLVRLPVDILKLDRTFIRSDAPLSGRERAFTQAILDLGHSLQLQTIAECVETHDQADMLRDMRCALGQGYLFSQPQEAAAIGELARAGNERAASAKAS